MGERRLLFGGGGYLGIYIKRSLEFSRNSITRIVVGMAAVEWLSSWKVSRRSSAERSEVMIVREIANL